MDELYQEVILEHARHPHHYGELASPTLELAYANASCGDSVSLAVRLDDSGTIVDIAWNGQGCVLSQAAASAISEWAVGRLFSELQGLSLEAVLDVVGLPSVAPARTKCLLALVSAAKNAPTAQVPRAASSASQL